MKFGYAWTSANKPRGEPAVSAASPGGRLKSMAGPSSGASSVLAARSSQFSTARRGGWVFRVAVRCILASKPI
jgi:hypothetical protein